MRLVRDQNGFTLIETIIIIVIVGILGAVAIPRYINLTRDATDGAAKGVLGALRSQNTLMFCQRITGRTTASYTMRVIANNVAGLKGMRWTAAGTRFTMTIGSYSYRFTLTPTPRAPTTMGSITAGVGTFRTW